MATIKSQEKKVVIELDEDDKICITESNGNTLIKIIKSENKKEIN